MEIHILRDGKESGPYSAETVQRLLAQNTVSLEDSAWSPGLPAWAPLRDVLAREKATLPRSTPPAAAAATRPGPEAAAPVATGARDTGAAAAVEAPAATVEPAATARQRAFLSYMGVELPAGATKSSAALLVNEAMENPTDPGRLSRWNEDRLRLHPELFAAELKAKRENRPNRFFELAETEGAECFDGLTKAHSQVLIGFLDLKHPNWDVGREEDAAWNYFFPAVSEKFPEVVRREWRKKLRFHRGPKVATELTVRSARGRLLAHGTTSPLLALLKGMAIGAVVVLVITGGLLMLKRSRPQGPAPAPERSAAAEQAAKAPSAPAKRDKPKEPIAAPVLIEPAEPAADAEKETGIEKKREGSKSGGVLPGIDEQ